MGLSPWAAMGLALLDMEVRWVCGLDKRGQACGLAVWACVRSAQGKKGQLPGGLCKRRENRERDREIGQRLGCECVWVNPTRSWLVWCGDRVMMSTRGKEKDVDKGLSTPERTPKDLTRTVARPRSHEDQAVYGCVGCVSIGGKSKTKSRKSKEAAGASGQVGADDVHLAAALPIQTDVVNAGTGLTTVQLNPTEVRVDGTDVQLEHGSGQADGAGGAGRLQGGELEGEVSPHTGLW
ncbi:hypothetical protein Bca52824_016899 [Brassica carinata]|uniref:Uncharacterized protein n=1 Tax=Brassica carinata TaxID=52824 RepID=A0A8X8AWP4_BRACI|nr:hypothetical protein Bca52824_016899 [Brassica carinata]